MKEKRHAPEPASEQQPESDTAQPPPEEAPHHPQVTERLQFIRGSYTLMPMRDIKP